MDARDFMRLLSFKFLIIYILFLVLKPGALHPVARSTFRHNDLDIPVLYAYNVRKKQGAKKMKTTTVGEIQKNFAKVLRDINAGEEITVTRRDKPVAKITAIGPRSNIDWPDFYNEAIQLEGKPVSEIIVEGRQDRF